ncbi:MAG: prepilin-type N-terminal cleavage/methylation domain-containing protein [Anaerohalosphaera sp.]|nr:prepilin-type N-terminal cleavage/methylation domain-containing protein [Anaerohalosphaera sp.]
MFSVRNNMVCGRGFTLVEVMMGVLVSSIIFGAIGTLAFAMSSAHEQTKDMSEMQAYIRYTSDRLRDEMRQSVKMWYVSGRIALWKGDLNADDQINGNELVYIETNADYDILQLHGFPSSTRSVTVTSIKNGSALTNLISNDTSQYTVLLPVCSNLSFTIPGNFRLLNISFDLSENGSVTSYDVCGTLGGASENKFDSSGALKALDDD